jgi:ubiquinone/menaquinone biosynthesis C-methylase UbiE
MNGTPEEIREDVRQHYTKIAETSGACCGPDPCQCHDYTDAELALVPSEAASISLGCGNPTALASLQPGEVVLDLGSGGGLDVLLAAQRVGPSGRAYGVDTTPAMIDLARRNAARAGVTNVEFLPGDLESLPLPDETVDVVISNCVINLTADKTVVLREAYRVLRPGGRLAVSDVVIDPDLAGFPVTEAEIRRSLDWAACAAGALTTAEMRAALEQAGFTDIALEVVARTTPDELPQHGSPLLERLGQDGLRRLAERFTSTSITARRP